MLKERCVFLSNTVSVVLISYSVQDFDTLILLVQYVLPVQCEAT